MRPRYIRTPEGFLQYHFSNPSLRAFTTTRRFNAVFEEEGGSRQEIFQALQLNPNDVVGACQVHGREIVWVGAAQGGKGALKRENAFQNTDGFETNETGIVLSIKTADCLPLFLADPSTGVLALVHAGWKGVRAGIVEESIEMLERNYSADPGRIEAVLGPSLQFEDFEVGDEFGDFFPAHVERTSSGKLHFDLPGEVMDRLTKRGLNLENILNTEASTFQERDSFFSYRREGSSTGRLLSLFWQERKNRE